MWVITLLRIVLDGLVRPDLRCCTIITLLLIPIPAISAVPQDPFSEFILDVCDDAVSLSAELAATCLIVNPPVDPSLFESDPLPDPDSFAIISTGNLNNISTQKDSLSQQYAKFADQEHLVETDEESGGSAGLDFGHGRWNGQLNLLRIEADRVRTEFENGYDSELTGLVVASTYQYSDDLLFGGSLSLLENDTTFDNNEGHVVAKQQLVSLFVNRRLGQGFSTAAHLGFGHLHFRNNRRSSVTGQDMQTVGGIASGDPNGSQVAAGFSVSHSGEIRRSYIRSFVDINYWKSTTDAYTETGDDGFLSSGLAMTFAERSRYSLTTSAGLQLMASDALIAGVTPVGSVAFVREHRQDSGTILGVLSGAEDSVFIIPVEPTDTSYFFIGIGARVRFAGNGEFSLMYQERLGDSLVDSWSLSVGARITF